jgi:hypothetical protein
MGAAATQNTGSQVYFDPGSQRYYTLNVPTSPKASSGLMSALNPIYNVFSESIPNRNYLNGSLYQEPTPFTPAPSINDLFPGLNAGLPSNLSLSQGLMSPTQPGGAMSGAGRFLAPQTTNTQGK